MRKGDKIATVLKILEVSAYTLKELISLFDAPKGSMMDYHATLGERFRYQDMTRREREADAIDTERELREAFETKQQLYETISRLKSDGLIKEGPKIGALKLLLIGKKKLKSMQEKRLSMISPNRYGSPENDKILKIVSFDIPEKERRKRDWLRSVLYEFGFEYVQQSLLMGYAKLPTEFLNDLAELRLIKCVKIFAVTKSGNLDELKVPIK